MFLSLYNNIHKWFDDLILGELGFSSHFTVDAIIIIILIIFIIFLIKIFLDIWLLIKLIKQNKKSKRNFDKMFLKLLADSNKQKVIKKENSLKK